MWRPPLGCRPPQVTDRPAGGAREPRPRPTIFGVSLGLAGKELYSVVVMGALPAAQNVTATKYKESELLARDAVFWTTILSVPALLAVPAMLGHQG